MGEAKQRRLNDSLFGKYPKAGRGLIVSNPMSAGRDGSFFLKDSAFDPDELRRAVLFWDKLVWPRVRNISFDGGADADFLRKAKILNRYEVEQSGGFLGHVLLDAHDRVFKKLDQKEPGVWSVSEGTNSLKGFGDRDGNGRGLSFQIYNAIPLPKADVPLADLLEFKHRRMDEVRSLCLELDGVYTRIKNSVDSDFEMRRSFDEIDQRCSDMLRVAKESNLGFLRADLKLDFSINLSSLASLSKNVTGGALLGAGVGLPHVGAILGGVASFVSLSAGPSIDNTKKSSPYRFIANLHSSPI